ncbi:distal tail protein Dit [Clostridioides difficile]|uniref:distal tail protein Dit n=1 Tax=Clostridioides difficile TaxID=1496 RepID=UPI000BB1B439|nr:distal tail protein Dit [Clostridioides difficile]MBY1124523.1 phage tail family protein [Clostridioides difficile]MDS6337776.1 phage tail family protein [Clostridioides difficile]PBF35101.1 phage tail protein [Clostridioides difficile]PBI52429.1 phage tail protein [Clostridioides difficile]PBI58660.1 phage tail protein [Clostridioides difficile]
MFFVYNGRDSREFGLKIYNINDLSAPQMEVERVSVPGKDGDLLLKKGFENFTLTIECDIDARQSNIEEVATEIKKWLQGDISYKKLFLSNSDFYYLASCNNKLDITRNFKNFASCLLTFDCYPFRYAEEEIISLNVLNLKSAAITNFYRESKPVLYIEGAGDISIKINTQSIVLRGVAENGILSDLIIDSEQMNVYRINKENNIIVNENNKLFSDFPILEEGENQISWEGDIKSIKINPRWNIL